MYMIKLLISLTVVMIVGYAIPTVNGETHTHNLWSKNTHGVTWDNKAIARVFL